MASGERGVSTPCDSVHLRFSEVFQGHDWPRSPLFFLLSPLSHSRSPRSRRALPTTDSDDKLMAALAQMGESKPARPMTR